jgi:hypothetical protein
MQADTGQGRAGQGNATRETLDDTRVNAYWEVVCCSPAKLHDFKNYAYHFTWGTEISFPFHCKIYTDNCIHSLFLNGKKNISHCLCAGLVHSVLPCSSALSFVTIDKSPLNYIEFPRPVQVTAESECGASLQGHQKCYQAGCQLVNRDLC